MTVDLALLSLVKPAPPGFLYREQLTARDVRRGAFILYAPSRAAAEAALAAWPVQLYGLLITPGAALHLEPAPGGLLQMTLREQDLPALPAWLKVVCPLVQALAEQQEQGRVLTLEVERLILDRTQAATEFANYRTSLLAENQVRRRAEQALRSSEERLHAIYDSVSDAIFIHHPETGKIQDVNRRACEMYGYERDEILTKTVPELSSPEPQYAGPVAVDLVRQARIAPQSFVWRARHKSGRLFWVEVTLRCAVIQEAESILVTVRDITERRQAEEQARYLEAQLLQNQKLESLGVLAGGIAHDFNNLLLAIMGNAELAGSDLSPTSPARGFLNEIDRASRRAADLCRQLLAYAGRGQLQSQPLNLNEVLREMDHLIEVSIPRKVSIRYDLEEALPAIQADASQIRQVILNLVINAAEALDDRSGVISLSTGSVVCSRSDLVGTTLGANLPEGRYAFFEVSDNGCGMSAEVMEKVFDPFFTTKFTGRGLGLPAVYGIVHSHQGAIRLTSAPGRGTTLRILLPVLHQAPPPPAPGSDAGWRGHGTILVVDDEEPVRVFSRHSLEKMGFRVLLAEDGRKALKWLQKLGQRPPEDPQDQVIGVLLDLTMPHMDGEETFHALRALQAELPVVISSGYNEQDVVPRFAGQTRVGFLQKPYRAAALRAVLKSMLG